MENNNFNIEEELKKLPGKPGVYIMHDEKDNIIYVGKAISLKNRVRQYFQSSRNKGVKIEQMVTHIRRFEYIVTDSELEALVLECNLIKEHRPKYNTTLMDDKADPFIKVTVNEAYPRVMLARRMPVSYTHLDVYKRQISSLAKDWTTRIPASVSCRLALTSPIFLRFSIKVTCMRLFWLKENTNMQRTRTSSGTASFQLMRNRKTKEPIIFIREIKRFSGPWCANSAIDRKSVV